MSDPNQDFSLPSVPMIVVKTVGDIDVSGLHDLWDRLREALNLRPDRLVVDLGSCPFVDAQAMNVLLEIHRAAWQQGGRLVLRGCSPAVLRLLELGGFADVFLLEQPSASTSPDVGDAAARRHVRERAG